MMKMFESAYNNELEQYYNLRCSVLSDSAIKHELCYLQHFDQYIKDCPYGEISESIVTGWISTLKGKSGSIENQVVVIRKFLNFLSTCGISTYLPETPKVRDDYIPYIFTDSEIDQIFREVDSLTYDKDKTDPNFPVEFPVILRLLYSCGMRVGETVQIELKNVDLDHGVLKLVNTKRSKHRLVPMSPGMADILYKYCLGMGLTGKRDGWLFPMDGGDSHVKDTAVKYRFEKILEKLGIQLKNRKWHERGPCLHCMRHVFAFKSFAQGERNGMHVDGMIPYLSLYLGHDSLNETAKYLKFSSEMFPEAIDAFGSFMDDLLPEVNFEDYEE